MTTYTFSNRLNGKVLFSATLDNASRILDLEPVAIERIKREVEAKGKCELFISRNIFNAPSIIATK